MASRAAALPGQYAAKAGTLDQHFSGTEGGQVGPVEARLQRFEPVPGLVFGAWGEASPDMEGLFHACVASGAARHWRGMQASNPKAARSGLLCLLRRRWGIASCREAARLTCDRLQLLCSGAATAEARRIQGRERAASARRTALWQLHGARVSQRRGRYL